MRVFVTGGTGLVGRRFVRRVHERGDQVVILTRRAGHAGELFGDNATVVEGDPMRRGDWMEPSPIAMPSFTWPERTSSPVAGTPTSRNCCATAAFSRHKTSSRRCVVARDGQKVSQDACQCLGHRILRTPR